MSYFLGKAFNAELYNVSDDPTVNNSSYLASSVAVSIVNSKLDALRKTLIGCPIFWRSTKLPDNYCWANGDFVEFADWPELKEVYDAGGFEGMLMAWDADAGTQAANLGKWRPDAANPSGLFTPNLSGQFFRNWTPGADKNAGTWNAPGLPNLTGAISNIASGGGEISDSNSNSALYVSARGINSKNPGSAYGHTFQAQLDASRCNTVHGNSDTVMPPSVNQPVVVYLGRAAQV